MLGGGGGGLSFLVQLDCGSGPGILFSAGECSETVLLQSFFCRLTGDENRKILTVTFLIRHRSFHDCCTHRPR